MPEHTFPPAQQDVRAFDFVLVGGGAASVAAARTLRREAPDSTIAMLCAEQWLPYERPALTGAFLGGNVSAADLEIVPETYYAEQRITVVRQACVVQVDPGRRLVSLDDGRCFAYGTLLIATGATPRVPEIEGIELPGVFCVHDLDDAIALRHKLQNAQRAVVIGAGFVGIEIAASLRARQIDVTLIERAACVLDHLYSSALSDFFFGKCIAHGIEVRLKRSVRRIVRRDGSIGEATPLLVAGVETSDGELIGCDIVVTATGVEPCCAFLEGSGIRVNDGVVVDAWLQSSDPCVFAAGDVARFDDPVFGYSGDLSILITHVVKGVFHRRVQRRYRRKPSATSGRAASGILARHCNRFAAIPAPFRAVCMSVLESGAIRRAQFSTALVDKCTDTVCGSVAVVVELLRPGTDARNDRAPRRFRSPCVKPRARAVERRRREHRGAAYFRQL